MSVNYSSAMETCKRHEDRLSWAMAQLNAKFPLTAQTTRSLNDTELAVMDQMSTYFAKLQDAMGVKLSPAVLELTKEQGSYPSFLDKLNHLEKIGTIASADQWLILREMCNELAHATNH